MEKSVQKSCVIRRFDLPEVALSIRHKSGRWNIVSDGE